MTLFTLLFRVGIFLLILFLIDLYAYQGIKFLSSGIASLKWRNGIRITYWAVSFIFLILVVSLFFIPSVKNGPSSGWVSATFGFFAVLYLPKLVFILFLLVDDIQSGTSFLFSKLEILYTSLTSHTTHQTVNSGMSRSDFIIKAGILTASIPFASVLYGIFRGRYEYTIRKVKIKIPQLPEEFEGFTITQVSDIHTGSFDNPEAVKKGFEMINAQKSDIICFTGDLVNNKIEEAEPYLDIFSSLRASMGVYSILGNHDYGDYVRDWKPGEKENNFRDMIHYHQRAGWKLLMNENVVLEKNGQKIALAGVENWGAKGGFARYGKLNLAMKNTADIPVKILMSHDPSHWDAEVRKRYQDIQLTLSGHTHGFQFGVDIFGIKWSPVQYVYKQWAGLYSQGGQHLYVNRGFGFIGFPGRVGILPEITVLELSRA